MRWLVSSIFLTLLLVSQTAIAKKPHQGFHTGPYLMINAGLLEYDWDFNQRTQIQEGDRYEPVLGFTFGWYFNDFLATEFETRYSTSKNSGRREHIALLNVGVTLSPLIDPLLGLGRWNILPFINANLAMNIASLPGDSLASDNRVSTFGIGPGMGVGIRFQWRQYLYFGLHAKADWIHQPSKSQEIFVNGSSSGVQEIYRGGFHSNFSFLGSIGVHY